MFKGKFGGLKLAIKKWLLLFGYELIRDKEGNNKLKKIYSSKPAVQFMKDYNKKDNLIVAEVGVWKGDTTKHIIKILPIKKNYAKDAVKDIKEKLDFIYIDADHDYEPVKKDIELYYKLLHKGGVLSGDDIQNRKIPNGVGKALAEFAVKNNLDFFIEGNNWWIIKK